MSLSWRQRKSRLAELLKSGGDEEEEGIALDCLTHGQNVIGTTSKTKEVNSLRFGNQDLEVVGTLEVGQYGVIDLVTCRLNNCVYVRKSIEKVSALRMHQQCFPQLERDILLQALKTQSPWAPHLLCAFQTSTHLNLVMDYAEGGTLWDVLESSPHDGCIPESDLHWWVPQAVSAIHWCHSQGFAHRDVKPHNFILTGDAHLLLIDFGSSAPLLPPNVDGSQRIPKHHCLIPCGTCDYISPEILKAHEQALVALEMEDDDESNSDSKPEEPGEYGLETDWWSLGAMAYELAYGIAPFFASDIRSTYVRITNHETSLRFNKNVAISHELQHLLRRLLTHAQIRLGRRNVMEITEHPFFEGADWGNLPTQSPPAGLHLPHFIYSEQKLSNAPTHPIPEQSEDAHSQGFPFSFLFQSSASVSPGLSFLRPSPGFKSTNSHSLPSAVTSFIGFTWGPTTSAFLDEIPSTSSLNTGLPKIGISTPALSPRYIQPTLSQNQMFNLGVPSPLPLGQMLESHGYSTPLRPYSISPHATLPRTSTIRRTAPKRGVSDREAMKRLVDCIGMSARKRVLESGRKPKILDYFSAKRGTMKKELRFDERAKPIPVPVFKPTSAKEESRSHSRTTSSSRSLSRALIENAQASHHPDESDIYEKSLDMPDPKDDLETTDSEGGVPPSPSPSPRPGSAMSTMSMTMISRRSATPSGSIRRRATSASASKLSAAFLPPPSLSEDTSVTVNTTSTATATRKGGGLLRVPSSTSTMSGMGVDKVEYPPPERFMMDDWVAKFVSDGQLVDLEERHDKIMHDIRQLQDRLDQLHVT